MPVSPARRAAFEILRRVEQEQAYSSALLAAADNQLDPRDRALCHQLVLGVLRERLWLDRCIEHFGARPIKKLDAAVVVALRLGLYQLRYLSRIPPAAAVNESVNLVRAARLRSAATFANAVLRHATREPDYDPAAKIEDPIERLAVSTSHPVWLIERWIKQLGFAETFVLTRANNDPAPLAFRFTARAGSQSESLIDQLQRGGMELRPSSIAANGWRVVTSKPSAKSAGADTDASPAAGARQTALLRQLSEEGLIYFQDESSQMVAELLGVKDGERVLDVCAAPGSKTTLIAAQTAQATVVAGDLYEHRVRTIKQFAAQHRAQNIVPVTYDATRRLPFTSGLFDRVLVDAPCSGTGTLRHNPEIRWRLQPADLIQLSEKQKKILGHAALMVRLGGVLVYSTCSMETEENEQVIGNFRDTHPEFERFTLDAPQSLLTDGAVRTWPHRDDADGFFVTAFRRLS